MNKIYKTILGASAVALAAGVTLVPEFVNAWGNSGGTRRPSYTISDINAGKLGDTITFNSISNSKIGDEKNFVGAMPAGSNADTWNADTINVEDGKTYTIRLYVHNNSPKGTEAIAKDVKATFAIPNTVSNSLTVVGYLDSSNATPNRYWDEITFNSSDNFYLEYVKDSAKYTNDKMGTVALPNEVIVSGATLGYSQLDGNIPGCYEYDGVVTIDVKVHKSVSTKLTKVVRLKGTKEWKEVVDAKVGDEVEYQIGYTNLLSEQAKNVMIRDVLATNVEYVPNSTYLFNSSNQNGVLLSDNTVTTTGINIGNYNAEAQAYVRFTGKVVNKTLKCGDNQLVNWASATVNGEVYKDDASVMVKIENCSEPDTPDTPDTPEVSEPINTHSYQTPTTETTTRIAETGAGEIGAGALGVGSMITALGYYIASRKKLM